jgi:hypothetical protein
MKHKLLFLLPLLAFTTACMKSNKTTPPVVTPSGAFVGQFRLLHKKAGHVSYDTLKANITVTMQTPDNTYAVTGDTSTLHAGSNGSFSLNASYISFVDKTYPTTGIPTKTHLSGSYLYYYDGSILQMLAFSSDTLSLQYDLKRSN